MQWQWFDSAWNTWSDYSRAQNWVIEEAWQQEKTSVNVDDVGWPCRWVINLVSLRQKPLEGDTLRCVRRVLVTHA